VNKQDLRACVFDVLRKTPQTHFHAVENEVRQRMDEFDRSDVLVLHEILWNLLLQGVLAPGKNSLNLHLPFVHVTEHGARCLEEGAILAHDPDGYVARLRSYGTQEDVTEIAREAILCYLAGRHAATAVLLARSTAAVLRQLRDELVRTGSQQGRGTRSLTAAASPDDVLRAVRRALLGRSLPAPSAELQNAQFSAASALLDADAAPDAGRLPPADPDRVLAYVLLFPEFCQFAYTALAQLDPTARGR